MLPLLPKNPYSFVCIASGNVRGWNDSADDPICNHHKKRERTGSLHQCLDLCCRADGLPKLIVQTVLCDEIWLETPLKAAF
jgi:hypothetical protein